MMMKILVIDDEKNLRESLVELIESENYVADSAGDGAEGLLKIRANDYACILLDIKMPRMDGLQLLTKLREEDLTKTPIIVISAFGESEQTIEAMRLGAFDYLTKPLDIDEVTETVKHAVEQFFQSKEVTARDSVAEKTLRDKVSIIGSSRAMRDVFKQIGRVSATDATVLITGESGTGKELVARAIHEYSARKDKPFVAVNCGALPENLVEAELFGYEKGAFTGANAQKKGRFETANGGTLFLDEIGEMPLAAQVKLLRALQERRFERVGGTQTVVANVRVVAATNRDLQAEIKAGNFREDLFYRLNVISIHLPPLRERIADIPALAEFFLDKTIEKYNLPNKNFAESAMRALVNYGFAGNVRELENLVERAAVASGVSNIILPEQLFQNESINASAKSKNENLLDLPFKEAISKLEKALIEKALRETSGNRSEAARKLQINRRLLYDKIEEHKISE